MLCCDERLKMSRALNLLSVWQWWAMRFNIMNDKANQILTNFDQLINSAVLSLNFDFNSTIFEREEMSYLKKQF